MNVPKLDIFCVIHYCRDMVCVNQNLERNSTKRGKITYSDLQNTHKYN